MKYSYNLTMCKRCTMKELKRVTWFFKIAQILGAKYCGNTECCTIQLYIGIDCCTIQWQTVAQCSCRHQLLHNTTAGQVGSVSPLAIGSSWGHERRRGRNPSSPFSVEGHREYQQTWTAAQNSYTDIDCCTIQLRQGLLHNISIDIDCCATQL